VPRNIFAWVLITLGLAAIASGLVMGYVVYVVKQTEAENAKANARMNPFAMNPEPPRKSIVREFGSAGISVIAGIIPTYVGVNLRVPMPRKMQKGETTDAGPKQTCSACGGLSPPTAMRCYHCGRGFLPA